MSMQKLIYNPFSLVVALFLVIISVISLQKNTQELRQSGVILAQTQKDIEKLDAQIIELQTQNEVAKSDFQQQKIIRNELLMKKPGEYVVIVADEEKEILQKKQTTKQSNWKQWQNLIFE